MNNPSAKPSGFLKLSSVTGLQLFQLIRYGAFALIGVIFAKLHVPQSEIATYEWLIMMAGLLSYFVLGGVVNTMLSLYPQQSEEGKGKLLINSFIILVAYNFLAALGVWLLRLTHVIPDKATYKLLDVVVIYNLFNVPAYLIEYILYLKGRKKALLVYGLLSSALLIGLLSTAALNDLYGTFHDRFFWTTEFFEISVIICLVTVAFLKWCFLVGLLFIYGRVKPNWQLMKQHVGLALPILLAIFVSGSSEYIDGLIVKSMPQKFGEVGFAVFRYGAKELPILLIVANTLSTAMIVPVAANLTTGLEELKNRSRRLMHLFFPVTIVLLIISPPLFRYVFSENFVYSSLIFNIYLLLAIPRLVFPQTILTALKHNRFQLLSAIIELSLNVSLSIWLAHVMGLPGIAFGTLIAFIVDKLFQAIVVSRVCGIKPSQYVDFKPYLAYSFLSLLAFALSFKLFQGGFWDF
ncbi:MAG: polysaccharide biosynthesis C-terminal domain-containing protein [Chitinophagales bacterium]